MQPSTIIDVPGRCAGTIVLIDFASVTPSFRTLVSPGGLACGLHVSMDLVWVWDHTFDLGEVVCTIPTVSELPMA